MSTTNLNSPATAPAAPSTEPNQFRITRTFDAPRDLLWKVLTQPEHLMHWWGPKGLTMISANVDLRPGGLFHYGMKMPNDQEMWGRWVFTEVNPPESMTYLSSFSDSEGGITRHPMSEGWPLEMLCTMSLSEQDGRTTLNCTALPYNATDTETQTFVEGHSSMKQGFGGTFDQLAAYLETL